MERVKGILSSQPVLKFFDPTKPVKLQVDASKLGLGGCMPTHQSSLHRLRKELLAVVFECERFIHYVYGRPVEVDSDHKPPVPITKKPLVKSRPRLQRLLLRLQKYDIRITYVPGKYMHVADTLSRTSLNEKSADSELNDSHKKFRNKALICSFRNPQEK